MHIYCVPFLSVVPCYRALFRQKKDEVHSPEEILHFFDSSFCACFALTEDRAPGARMQLFGKI